MSINPYTPELFSRVKCMATGFYTYGGAITMTGRCFADALVLLIMRRRFIVSGPVSGHVYAEGNRVLFKDAKLRLQPAKMKKALNLLRDHVSDGSLVSMSSSGSEEKLNFGEARRAQSAATRQRNGGPSYRVLEGDEVRAAFPMGSAVCNHSEHSERGMVLGYDGRRHVIIGPCVGDVEERGPCGTTLHLPPLNASVEAVRWKDVKGQWGYSKDLVRSNGEINYIPRSRNGIKSYPSNGIRAFPTGATFTFH